MSFLKYQKQQSKKEISSRTIGINRKGRFVLYKPVVQNYLQESSHVELFYDATSKKMAILPLPEPSSDSFKIQGKTTKMVIAKKFLNRFQIAVEDRRYDFQVDNGMLIIQL